VIDVEIYEEGGDSPFMLGKFAALPMRGDLISTDAGGYFRYYRVLEAWHRQDGSGSLFKPRLSVALED
jgi:hypothetical protein